jgi:hypothetical protein
MHHSSSRALVFVFVLVGLVMSPSRAVAEDDDRAAAQALYDEALADMDRSDFAVARKKLEEVVQRVPEAGGAKVTLAECYESLGLLASAWSMYQVAATLAVEQGQSARAEKAQARIAALEPRLAKVRIEVPPDVAAIDGLAIARDALPVGRKDWGQFIPIDVGEHDVTASAPGYASFRKRFEITQDGQSVTVKVAFAAVRTAQPNPPKPKIAARAGPEGERGWQMPLGVTALAVGGAGIVVGAVMGGLSISRRESSPDAQGDVDLRQEGLTFGNVSIATLIPGVVLAVGGIILMVTAPSTAAEQTAFEIDVSPEGLSLAGSF